MKIVLIIVGVLIVLFVLLQILAYWASKARNAQANAPIPPDFKFNFDSPEAALETIENAYRIRNMAAILACRDFELEARFIIKRMPETDPKFPALLASNAMLCREHFLQLIRDHGIPEWNGVSVTVKKKEDIGSGMFIITEELTLPPGGHMEAMSFVGKGKDSKYKVLMPYSDEMRQAWFVGEATPTLEL